MGLPTIPTWRQVVAELARMRTAVLLLGVAALFSMLGTLVPQGLALEDYVSRYGLGGGQALWYSGLTEVFRAWWYLGLWVFLLGSVCACLSRNGPVIYRALCTPLRPRRRPALTGAAMVAGVTPAHLRALGLWRLGAVDGLVLYEKGRLNRLGYFGVHAGVVGVAMAGLLSGLAGWRGTLNIREGDSDRVALVWHGRMAKPEFLPFTVTNQAFAIDFYDSGMPRRFFSRLTFCAPGAPCTDREVEVNKPVRQGAYTFYQASFGDGGSAITGAGLDVASGVRTAFRGKIYEKSRLADGTVITLLDFRPATVETFGNGEKPLNVGASVDYLVQPPDREAKQLRAYLAHPEIIGVADGQTGEGVVQYRAVPLGVSLRDEAALWRAVAQVAAKPAGFREILAPLLAQAPDEGARISQGLAVLQTQKTLAQLGISHLIRLDAFSLRRYTGLQVAYDPGGWLFWLFALVLAGGVMLTLGRRLVRVWLDEASGQAWVTSPHGPAVVAEVAQALAAEI